jgi:hypothetical protein
MSARTKRNGGKPPVHPPTRPRGPKRPKKGGQRRRGQGDELPPVETPPVETPPVELPPIRESVTAEQCRIPPASEGVAKLSVLLPEQTLGLLDWACSRWREMSRGGRAITRSFVLREAIRSYYVLLTRWTAQEKEGVPALQVQADLLDALWGSTPDASVRGLGPATKGGGM